MPSLGEAIRFARLKREMTQEDLAALLNTTKSAISKYELGKREPNLVQLSKIAVALGITVSDLVDGDYWSTLSDAERKASFATNPYKELLNGLFDQLNEEGQSKAVERVEELTEIPKYQKKPQTD